MPITVAKDAASGPSDDTTYTIRNFEAVSIDTNMLVNQIPDLGSNEQAAILISELAPTMNIKIGWTIMDETTSVVSGAGGPVTTAIGQVDYLHGTLRPEGASQITDTYTVTLDYGGGSTFSRNGRLAAITTAIMSAEPLTFKAELQFTVGTVA